MPKNVQTTIQLYSLHMLARLCSKSFKLGLSNTWTKNFQMYKLSLGKAQELEIKLPTSTESWRKQGNSRKTSILKPLTVWTTTNWKILKKKKQMKFLPDKWVCTSISDLQFTKTCKIAQKQWIEPEFDHSRGCDFIFYETWNFYVHSSFDEK